MTSIPCTKKIVHISVRIHYIATNELSPSPEYTNGLNSTDGASTDRVLIIIGWGHCTVDQRFYLDSRMRSNISGGF